MQVLELMRVHAIRVQAGATLGEVVDMFDIYQHTGLPVVDAEDRILGFVTESAVAKRVLPPYLVRPEPRNLDDKAGVSEELRNLPVLDLMEDDVYTVDEHADVTEVARILLDRGLKRIPVTSEGRLVGTIGRNDICQAILDGEL